MADISFEHDSAGYVSLMKSGEMRAVLQGYADGIAASASSAMAPDSFDPPLSRAPYYAFDFTGRDRAGVRVQTNNPHARLAEAKHGHLQSAAGV